MENIEITYPGRATKAMGYVPVSRLKQVPEQKDEYPEFSMFGELPAWAFYVRHVNGLTMKNITVKLQESDYRPAFVLDDVRQVKLEGIHLPPGKSAQAIVLSNSDLPACEESLKKSIITIKP